MGHICEVLNIAPESRRIPSGEYLTAKNGLDYIWKIFSRVLRGYRVHMHLNGDSPKGFILTLLAEFISVILFKPAIITFHAGPYQKYFPQARALFLTPVYKMIFHLCKKIICNSDPVKEKIIGYGIHPEKIVTIQAFSRQYLQYNPISLNGKLGEFIADGKPLISSYVFFRPEFFIDKMIVAMAELSKYYPGLKLIILGSEDHSEKIRDQINDLNLENHVLIAGDQDHDSFLTILEKSDIFLRTPVKDGVASSVLEALSLKTLVVASENNTRPAGVVTYPNGDIPKMVEILRHAIENLEKLAKEIPKPEIMDTVKIEIDILTA